MFWGMAIANENLIQEEIKKRMNSGNGCYRPVQNLITYKTIILPVVLFGTWSLTLREEHRLSVFENREQRRIFGLKRDEVMGRWRKLHNEKLRDLYSSPSVIRIIESMGMRWAGHLERMRDKRNGYGLLVRKPEGKRPLERLRRR
jgi:hypothetical protein